MRRPTPCASLLLAALVILAGCTDARRYDQAIAILIDVSGTYADEKPEAVRIIKREILPSMEPGDTLLVMRIDSESYEEDNVEALVRLDARPSKANAQKLAIARKLDAFAKTKGRSAHTDIPGAMMLAAEYLTEVGSASRVILVFSDMEEDLPKGTTRELDEAEFRDIRIVAMNVKRLKGDTVDPQVFRKRMASWEDRVTAASAESWRMIMDDAKLPALLAQIR